jgi:hypothetical protein
VFLPASPSTWSGDRPKGLRVARRDLPSPTVGRAGAG